MHSETFWYLTNQGVLSGIGSGNPSCLLIAAAFNGGEHRVDWREQRGRGRLGFVLWSYLNNLNMGVSAGLVFEVQQATYWFACKHKNIEYIYKEFHKNKLLNISDFLLARWWGYFCFNNSVVSHSRCYYSCCHLFSLITQLWSQQTWRSS